MVLDPDHDIKRFKETQDLFDRIQRAGGVAKYIQQNNPQELIERAKDAEEFRKQIEEAGGVQKFAERNEQVKKMIQDAGGVDGFARRQEKLREFAMEKLSRPSGSSGSSSTQSTKASKPLPSINIREADAEYKPFPSFSEWSTGQVNKASWVAHVDSLRTHEISDELLRRARAIVSRAAAVDSGALEYLYEVDKGFTFTVATQAATWEAALDKKGAEVRALIESQMEAYEMVLDFATKKQPIAEAWIRELHVELCKSQKTYKALTEIGWQQLRLPHGKYKELSNHVIGRDGKVHSYAPVDQTPSEMHRLIQELSSDEFLSAHPVLQSAYAHYAFVSIHPFADGNGRVSRALASVYTYRSESIPLLILMENRQDYIDALTAADNGDHQPFIDFVFERALDAVRMTEESLRAASAPELEHELASYRRLYITKGGYTHDEVDAAGYQLMNLFVEELKKQAAEITSSGFVGLSTALTNTSNYNLAKETSRHPVKDSGRTLVVTLGGPPPARPNLTLNVFLEVPRDCDKDDEVILSFPDLDRPFVARITELIPTASAALQLRISILVRGFLGLTVKMLKEQARSKLQAAGYNPL